MDEVNTPKRYLNNRLHAYLNVTRKCIQLKFRKKDSINVPSNRTKDIHNTIRNRSYHKRRSYVEIDLTVKEDLT
jgi:hypothetical protein